jgi:sugar transferase (PEP-CTERM/EpsH1 system associated)
LNSAEGEYWQVATILFLTHRVPYPPDKGDRIRTFHMLRFLARRANVYLGCLADEQPQESTLVALRPLCSDLTIATLGRLRWLGALASFAGGGTISEGAFQSSALTSSLGTWASEVSFDACLVSSSAMFPYLRLPGLRHLPAVVDFMDVDSQKWLDFAAATTGPKRWLYRMEGQRMRRLEQRICGQARAVLLVSQAEANLFARICPWEGVRVVPNGVDLDYFRAPALASDDGSCVFIGALDYLPNVDACCWFTREVWPALRRVRPEATLRLVGRQPVPAVRRLAEVPGVEVVGQVPDVRPYLNKAAVAVAPLRLARGVQNKVLEAMAASKPVVSSPEALVGLTGLDVPVLTATEPLEWVNVLSRLLSNQGLRTQLGEAGRRYTEEHRDWDRSLRPLEDLLGLEKSEGKAPTSLCATEEGAHS